MESVFVDVADIDSTTRFSHHTVVMVLPYIDHKQVLRLEPVLRMRALQDGLLVLVYDSQRIGFIKIANLVFAKSTSKYFGYLAQDAFPGDGWLKCGVSTLEKSKAWLLPFSDGRFYGTVAVFALLLRSWAKSLYHNCVFFPGYRRHYGDTELSVIAIHYNKLVFNPACMLCEVDYEKHMKPNDQDDDALYHERLETGFGGIIPPQLSK